MKPWSICCGQKFFHFCTPNPLSNYDKRSFLSLTRLNLKTAQALRIKEAANGLWSYSYRGVTERNWKSFLGWILLSSGAYDQWENGENVSVVDPECDTTVTDQRDRGICQCNDSEDQSERMWVSKSGKILERNSLPTQESGVPYCQRGSLMGNTHNADAPSKAHDAIR